MRLVSYFELSSNPKGGEALACLGTGPYEGVFSRKVTTPRISFFFSHTTNDYLNHFVSFGKTRFNDETKSFDPTTYRDPFEAAGGPLWLYHIANDIVTSALTCIASEPPTPPEGYWMKATNEQPLVLITSTQALAELSGEQPHDHSLGIYIHFQGSMEALATLIPSDKADNPDASKSPNEGA